MARRKQTEETREAPEVTAKGRYATLSTERTAYVERAERCAQYTIPALFPRGRVKNAELPTPYQSTGARGVNNLAAKLLLALFPPGGSFFRLVVDDFVLESMAQQWDGSGQDPRADIEDALSRVERSVMGRFESAGCRSPIFSCLKHLIVAGNGLLQVLDHGRLKFHPLSSYVLKRDLEGSVLEIVVEERLARQSLPPDIRGLLPEQDEDDLRDETAEVDIYTWITRTDAGSWTGFQEVEGKQIPGSELSYPEHKLPFLPLRFIAVDGEDYGRGYAEEYLGDLMSHDSLTGAVVDFAAVASKILLFVNEGGLTSKKDLQNAPSGAILDGRAEDVTTFQLEKSQDFSIAFQTSQDIKARLEQAFLLASSVQRNAERVTAEEIRVMAGELEQTLGGIYSVLAQELQLPLVSVQMAQLQREGKLPTLPEKAVSPQIVTGLEGLGRNSDLQKLQALLSNLQVFGPEAITEYLNVGGFLKRAAAYLGIDAKGLVREESEVQQARAQQAQQAIAEKMAGPAVSAGASLATQAAPQPPAAG